MPTFKCQIHLLSRSQCKNPAPRKLLMITSDSRFTTGQAHGWGHSYKGGLGSVITSFQAPYFEDVPTLGLFPTLVYNKPLQLSRMVHHNQLTTVAPSTTSMGQIKMTSG